TGCHDATLDGRPAPDSLRTEYSHRALYGLETPRRVGIEVGRDGIGSFLIQGAVEWREADGSEAGARQEFPTRDPVLADSISGSFIRALVQRSRPQSLQWGIGA